MTDAPAIRRFTVDEYHRLGEIGMIAPDARTELLDGIIYEMAPIGPGHMWPTTDLSQRFWRCADGRVLTAVQQPIALFDDGQPVPDVMLLRPDTPRSRIPTAADVLLIVEVADTTLRHDRTTKAARYAAARIADYWIYAVPSRSTDRPGLIVHRAPGPNGYADVRTYGPGEAVAPLALPDCPVDPADLSAEPASG